MISRTRTAFAVVALSSLCALSSLAACGRRESARTLRAQPVPSEVADAASLRPRVLFEAPPTDADAWWPKCVAHPGRLSCAFGDMLVEARSARGPVDRYAVRFDSDQPVFDVDDEYAVFARWNGARGPGVTSNELVKTRKSDGAESVLIEIYWVQDVQIADGRVFVAEWWNPHMFDTAAAAVVSANLTTPGARRIEVSGHRPREILVDGGRIWIVQVDHVVATLLVREASATRTVTVCDPSSACTAAPSDLAVHGKFLYWSQGSAILRSPRTGPAAVETVVLASEGIIEAFAFDGPSLAFGNGGYLYSVDLDGDRKLKRLAKTGSMHHLVHMPDGFVWDDNRSIRGI
jgi:hypothetical protein